MARRTAMNKEPKTESSRKGNDKSNDSLTRVSPGVYRNSQGKLVGSRGQSLGNRNGRPGDAIRNALGDMTNPGNRAPAGRPGQQTPPAGIPQDLFQQWQQNQQSPGDMAEQIARQVTGPTPNFEGIVRDAAGQLAQNNMANQVGQAMGNMQMVNYGDGRTLTPQERAARGIDPRDPNTYTILPDGQVIGTMMGWSPNMQGRSFGNAIGNQAQQGRAVGNSIGDLLRRGR